MGEGEGRHVEAVGSVESIHIAPSEGAPMQSMSSVRAIAGVGLEGDRYALRIGHYSANLDASRHITLIEAEVLDDLVGLDLGLPHGASRRNVVTRGIRLNELVGQAFRVGDVVCRATRLCEPCTYLEGLVGLPVLAPLVHRGGLRADILTDGRIAVGDAIAALEPARN
jgi:MOSC domain-containing protein YiiM